MHEIVHTWLSANCDKLMHHFFLIIAFSIIILRGDFFDRNFITGVVLKDINFKIKIFIHF